MEHGLFVVEGVKPVQELAASSFQIESVYATESSGLPADTIPISEKELGRISGLKTPNRVLAIAKIPNEFAVDWSSPFVLFLDGINDPGNMGTIIRTAKWFGVSNILCSDDCVDAYSSKVVQSSMGALFHVRLSYGDASALVREAKKQRFSIIGTAMNGRSVYEVERPEKILLVIGSESHGMREDVRKICDLTCSIPNREGEQKVESLNAGIATAIMLSEITRKSVK